MIRYPFFLTLTGLLFVAIAGGGEDIVAIVERPTFTEDQIEFFEQDYYSLAGIFNNSATQDLPLAADDIVKRFNDHEQAAKDLDSKIKSFRRKPKKDNHSQKHTHLPTCS